MLGSMIVDVLSRAGNLTLTATVRDPSQFHSGRIVSVG